MLTHKLESACG